MNLHRNRKNTSMYRMFYEKGSKRKFHNTSEIGI